MSESLKTDKCRKCGAGNPTTNQYCASCGAILQISTGMMEAQPKAVTPSYHSFEKRWLLISVFVLFGFVAVAAGVIVLLASIFFQASVSDMEFGLTGINTSAIGMIVLTVIVVSGLFFGAGMLISSLAKDVKQTETVLASIIVALIIGIFGQIVSSDFLWVSLLFFIPSTICVGIGAWVGGTRYARRPS